MTTPLMKVYDAFFNLIEDELYEQLTLEEVKKDCRGLLDASLPLFEFPNQSLTITEKITKGFGSEIDPKDNFLEKALNLYLENPTEAREIEKEDITGNKILLKVSQKNQSQIEGIFQLLKEEIELGNSGLRLVGEDGLVTLVNGVSPVEYATHLFAKESLTDFLVLLGYYLTKSSLSYKGEDYFFMEGSWISAIKEERLNNNIQVPLGENRVVIQIEDKLYEIFFSVQGAKLFAAEVNLGDILLPESNNEQNPNEEDTDEDTDDDIDSKVDTEEKDESYFNNELTTEEINILAYGMAYIWSQRQINTIDLLRQKFSGPDFKMSSQAAHLSRLKDYIEFVRKEHRRLQMLYSRRDGSSGLYKSTFGDLVKRI